MLTAGTPDRANNINHNVRICTRVAPLLYVPFAAVSVCAAPHARKRAPIRALTVRLNAISVSLMTARERELPAPIVRAIAESN